MCPKIYQVYRWKTETERTNRGRVYLYPELICYIAFQFGIQLTDEKLRVLFDFNFIINGKGIHVSLHKEINYALNIHCVQQTFKTVKGLNTT